MDQQHLKGEMESHRYPNPMCCFMPVHNAPAAALPYTSSQTARVPRALLEQLLCLRCSKGDFGTFLPRWFSR